MKTYSYELIENRPVSLIIRVYTRNKEKSYDFAIPKSVCSKTEVYKEVYENGKTVDMVKLTIESRLMYKFTWKKIQKWMESKGIKVKTWEKKVM